MTHQKSEIIYIRVTPDQRKGLDEIVERSGIGGLSDHIRKAIDEYLARHGIYAVS